MRNLNNTYGRVFSGIVAGAAVLAANLLVVQEITESEAAEVAEVPSIPAAPSPITSVVAPDLDAIDLYDDVEFVVPVLNRSRLELPPPPVEVEAIRATARAWLGDGVMAAPANDIEIVAPDVKALEDLTGPSIDVPELERPELPALPPIR